MKRKYEITEIEHPQYPWLHRIRALCPLRGDVEPGELGGYVQTESNLDQQGDCWLYGDSIAMEDARVAGDAALKDRAAAMGRSMVTGISVCQDQTLICDDAIVRDSWLSGSCVVGGNAHIHPHPQTDISPKICGHAKVYGEVSGLVCCMDNTVVLPGMSINNPTLDAITLSRQGVQVCVAWDDPSREILPPARYRESGIGSGPAQGPAQDGRAARPDTGDAR